MATPEASPATPWAPDTGLKPVAALPLVTLHDLLWLLYLYPLQLMAIVLPRWFLYAIGKLSDPVVQFQARQRKAKAAPWIARVCRTTPVNANRIASRSLSNKLFRFLDQLVLLRPSSDKMLRCAGTDGVQHLENAVEGGQGVILLVGHFCANRVAVRYLAAQGYAVLAIHNQRPSNKWEGRLGRQFLQPRSIRLQERMYSDQVYIQDPDCGLKIMRRLRAGGLAVIQMDGLGRTKAIEHMFLGVPWRVPSGIFEIVRLSGCSVVPMLCLGRSDGFRIRFDPKLEINRTGSRDAFVSAHLPGFLAAVEKQIVDNPEEWTLWNHF
jgi:lauroyl/myristoyl acyltransferase